MYFNKIDNIKYIIEMSEVKNIMNTLVYTELPDNVFIPVIRKRI